MAVNFFLASNGEQSCSLGKINLHSSYNPGKEAERFALNAEVQFVPKVILVTGPALSLCAPYLRKRFPKASLACIRYCDEFSESNSKWDKVFKAGPSLSEELFDFYGEEKLSQCMFLSWKPSEKAFPKEFEDTWNQIRECVLKCRNVLSTRNWFAKRWTKNALRFSAFTLHPSYFECGTRDIVICSSGPSLKSSIPLLKKYRNRIFLAAVSSALAPLCHEDLIPDLCISTDGGYWAKLHISRCLKNHHIPLALPGEGSCFGSVLNEIPTVPLCYGDGPSEDILKNCGYHGMKALRNGSVSGTAAWLCLSMTTGRVFYCGLDLAYSPKSHPHTQPNELEKRDSLADSRFSTMETRISRCVLNTTSINLYNSWFSNADFRGRLYRLSDNFQFSNSLGSIRDVNFTEFERLTEDYGMKKDPVLHTENLEFNMEQRRKQLESTVRENISSDEWIKNALPSESILLERSLDEHREELKDKIQSGMEEFSKAILKAVIR